MYEEFLVLSLAIVGLSQYFSTQARNSVGDSDRIHDEFQAKYCNTGGSDAGASSSGESGSEDVAMKAAAEIRQIADANSQGLDDLLSMMKKHRDRIDRPTSTVYFTSILYLALPILVTIVEDGLFFWHRGLLDLIGWDAYKALWGAYFLVGVGVASWVLIRGKSYTRSLSVIREKASELEQLERLYLAALSIGGSGNGGPQSGGGSSSPAPGQGPDDGGGSGAGSTILTGATPEEIQNQTSAAQGAADRSQSTGGLSESEVRKIIRQESENARDDDETQQGRREGRGEPKKKVDPGKIDQAEQIAIEFDEAQARQSMKELRQLEKRVEARRREEYRRDIRREIEAGENKERLRDRGSDTGSGGKSNNKSRPGHAAQALAEHARSMEQAARAAKEASQVTKRVAQTSEMLSLAERGRKSQRSLTDIVRGMTGKDPNDKNRGDPE